MASHWPRCSTVPELMHEYFRWGKLVPGDTYSEPCLELVVHKCKNVDCLRPTDVPALGFHGCILQD